MFVVTCPMREDALALTLEDHGRRADFRKVTSTRAVDAVDDLLGRLYPSAPSPDPWVCAWSMVN